jgi:microcystin-dependent protein
MQTSTRFGVSYPVAARTDPADVAVHIGNVVTGLEKAVRYDSGTLAARPTSSVGTPGITGRHYFATDENQMYFDYGTGWIGIMVQNQKQISTLNAAAATSGYASYVTGDTQPRFVIGADGKHQWGAGGAAAVDTTLYRPGAGLLMTDGTFYIGGSLYMLGTAHAIWVQSIPAAFSAFLVKAAADSQQRLRILGDGKILWGPGGSVVEDVNLYRVAANNLKTDGRFDAVGDIFAQGNIANYVGIGALGPQAQPALRFSTDTTMYRNAAGVLRTPGSLIVDGNVDVTGTLTGGGAVPTGAMMQYGGAAAPTGWLLADGAAVSRTTYAALFTAIGTQYGAGDGSTTFNLPNMKGRVAAGYDAGNANFNARGKTGGAETVALSVAEMATHAHGVTEAAHSHSMNNPTHAHGTGGAANGGYNPNAPGLAGVMGSAESASLVPINLQISGASANQTAVANSTGLSINNNGGGGAHNNLPPYIALNYIIKT